MELSPTKKVDRHVLRNFPKEVRVLFESLPKAEEARLRIKINALLRNGTGVAEVPTPGKSGSNRDDVRIILKNMMVSAEARETPKLVHQEFHAILLDLSARGSCLGVPEYVKLQKGGSVILTLDFLDPPLQIKAKILGAK